MITQQAAKTKEQVTIAKELNGWLEPEVERRSTSSELYTMHNFINACKH